jgi:PAS domain S-box-containing protein
MNRTLATAALLAAVSAVSMALGRLMPAGGPATLWVRVATGVCAAALLTLAVVAWKMRRERARLHAVNQSLTVEMARQAAAGTAALTRLRLALEGAEMGTWQWTIGTADAVLDDRQRAILDIPPDAPLRPDAIFAQFHPDDAARIRGECETWLRDGGLWEYEHRILTREGAVRWVAGRAAIMGDAVGPRVATGVTFDVTKQKQTEHVRRRAERQLKRFADSAPATLWATNATGATTFRSREWYVLTGQPVEEGLRFGWLAAVHEDDRSAVKAAVVDAHRTREPFTVEYRVRLADGSIIWVLDTGRPLEGGEPGFRGSVGSVVEITRLKEVAEERRQVEMALRESDERFRQLADHLDAGLWIFDVSTSRIRYASTGFARAWNVDPGGLGDKARWASLIHREDHPRVRDTFQAFLAGRGTYNLDYRIVLADGATRWVQDRAFVVSRDEQGAIRVVAGLIIDVTARRESEQALRDADRQKDVFLAMLGHELRNPLAPIRTATHLLGRADLDPDSRARARAVIERQVGHVVRLVDDLVDVSRLARNRLVLQKSRVDLVAIVRDTVDDYAAFLASGQLHLDLRLPDRPLWVDGDRTRLAQLLGNLLHNARKFTPAGAEVGVEVRAAGDDGVRLCVWDTGHGIDRDLLPRIFEPFNQGRQTLDRSAGGLGLGLSLVRGIVELHGGTVQADSAGEGHGALFDVRLPMAPSGPVDTPGAHAAGEAGGLRIVLVEDNEDAAEMMRLLLQSEGHQVSVAATGLDGIAMVEAVRPDLVLCDIGLPGNLSGLDVARHVRRQGHADVTLVALTGYAGDDHVRETEAAGFDRHLAKPIGPDELAHLLAAVHGARAARGPVPRP